MPDTAAGETAAPPVSPDNPCPFLRALVAINYVGAHVVPLPELSETVDRATGKTGLPAFITRVQISMVASIANGLGPPAFSRL